MSTFPDTGATAATGPGAYFGPNPQDEEGTVPIGTGGNGRLPLLRPAHGRMLGGVCRGVSLHLGVSVWLVRPLFIVATFLFAAGAVAYVFLWVFVPAGDPVAMATAQRSAMPWSRSPLSHGNSRYNAYAAARDTAHSPAGGASAGVEGVSDIATAASENLLTALKRASKPSLFAAAGLVLILVSELVTVSGSHATLVFSMLLGFVGIGVAWLRFDAADGRWWSMLVGVLLLFVAYTVYVMSHASPSAPPWHLVAAGLALLLGVGLAVVPWANALMGDLSAERVLKEREEQRADMTAHLHDGVLQTLALIQLHSTEPQTVVSLARQQERELRDWLYQERTPSERSVSTGLKDVAAQVEAEQGKPIEVVTVGDAQPSARTDALLDASRQALVNAAMHGGEPISAYCEVGDHMIEIFVRDHGAGFDVDHVPQGRLGIRESIVGRMRRRGGSVEIVSRAGWGTEVRMHMPLDGTAAASQVAHEGERQS